MIRYLGDYAGVFDPNQIRLMGTALDDAWAIVRASKATYATGDEAELTREALAKSIIAAAIGGELDPHQLSEDALAKLAHCKMKAES
jgi:hypothetical protein